MTPEEIEAEAQKTRVLQRAETRARIADLKNQAAFRTQLLDIAERGVAALESVSQALWARAGQ